MISSRLDSIQLSPAQTAASSAQSVVTGTPSLVDAGHRPCSYGLKPLNMAKRSVSSTVPPSAQTPTLKVIP